MFVFYVTTTIFFISNIQINMFVVLKIRTVLLNQSIFVKICENNKESFSNCLELAELVPLPNDFWTSCKNSNQSNWFQSIKRRKMKTTKVRMKTKKRMMTIERW